MLPYYSYTEFPVGPLTIHVWGLFVAFACLAAIFVTKKVARMVNLNTAIIEARTFWILIASFIGAKIGYFILYAQEKYWFEILKVWEGGWSSMGGIAGGVVMGLAYAKKKMYGCSTWRAADVMTVSFPLGFALGRLGCASIHDHIGKLSSFWLAIQFPGGSRHDLGLYEAILLFIFSAIFYTLLPKILKHEGLSARIVATGYAVIRFPLDFLRAEDILGADARYFSLTAAQYACVIMVVLVWLPNIIKSKRV
ncbi:MAG: prolipoprotein diacylglyceryl transferase family protein [bacterium]